MTALGFSATIVTLTGMKGDAQHYHKMKYNGTSLGLDQERPIDVQSAALHSRKYRVVQKCDAHCASTVGAGPAA
jgi:hypothetical protein